MLSSRTGAEFVRTPKTGGQKELANSTDPCLIGLARIEVGIGGAYLALSFWLFWRGDYLTALGFGLLIGAGLLWVGGGSWRISR